MVRPGVAGELKARRAGRGGSGVLTAALLLVVAVLSTATPGASAASSGQEASTEDADLAALRERIGGLERELQRLQQQRESVVSAFETADVELALRRQQLSALERRGELLEVERQRQADEVESLEAQLVQGRRALRARVVSLYRIGPLSYNRLLLSADTATDVLVGYQLVTYLASRDRDLVRSVRGTLDELRSVQVSLETTLAQLVMVRQDTADATAALEIQQEERRAALSSIDRESETQRVMLAEAERAALALEGTLDALVASSDVPVAAFAEARGALPWPAEGEIVGSFGRRRHPVYDTYTVSRGIEIGAAEGTPVMAIFAGRVVFADWYSGYGLLVIVDHGGGYFTLYGHLQAFQTRVNDRLEAGQPVGLVGETGSLSGPNLYFEVREGTDALNPTQWLQRR